jgi:hypothetical protein
MVWRSSMVRRRSSSVVRRHGMVRRKNMVRRSMVRRRRRRSLSVCRGRLGGATLLLLLLRPHGKRIGF